MELAMAKLRAESGLTTRRACPKDRRAKLSLVTVGPLLAALQRSHVAIRLG